MQWICHTNIYFQAISQLWIDHVEHWPFPILWAVRLISFLFLFCLHLAFLGISPLKNENARVSNLPRVKEGEIFYCVIADLYLWTFILVTLTSFSNSNLEIVTLTFVTLTSDIIYDNGLKTQFSPPVQVTWWALMSFCLSLSGRNAN